MKNYVTFCLANTICSLFIGLFAYLCFRENTFVNLIFKTNALLSEAVIGFYLPDFLWAYALCFALSMFCKYYYACIISSMFGVLWEVFQKFGLVRGTFDYFDILMYITASIIAVLILLLFNRRQLL